MLESQPDATEDDPGRYGSASRNGACRKAMSRSSPRVSSAGRGRSVDPDAVLAGHHQDDDREDASEVLAVVLADGPVWVKDAFARMDEAGFSKDQAKRAKTKLRACSVKVANREIANRVGSGNCEGHAKGAKSAAFERRSLRSLRCSLGRCRMTLAATASLLGFSLIGISLGVAVGRCSVVLVRRLGGGL